MPGSTFSRLGGAAIAAMLVSTAPLAAQVRLEAVGTLPGPAELVYASGDRAYTVLGRTITVFDISNPAAAQRGGSHTFPDKVWGIHVVGTVIYAAVDKYGLGVLDASNPKTLVLRGAFKTPGQAKSVTLVGSTALVADHMAGVNFIDVSDVTKPVSKGSYFLDGYARAVASAGTIAAAVDAPTGLYLFDLSNLSPPGEVEPVSSVQSAERPSTVELFQPTGSDTRLAALAGGGSLQLYDVTDINAPRKLAVLPTPGKRASAVAVQGTTAYVADGPEGVQIIDISKPSAPVLIGTHKTPFPARDVAVVGSLVLVAVAAPSAGDTPPADGHVMVLRRSS
jgi:hypothetical protein